MDKNIKVIIDFWTKEYKCSQKQFLKFLLDEFKNNTDMQMKFSKILTK